MGTVQVSNDGDVWTAVGVWERTPGGGVRGTITHPTAGRYLGFKEGDVMPRRPEADDHFQEGGLAEVDDSKALTGVEPAEDVTAAPAVADVDPPVEDVGETGETDGAESTDETEDKPA